MNRRHRRLISGISKSERGIEVAPWFNPLVPKSLGYNVSIVDVFDKKTLLARAEADPLISPDTYPKLEDVDFLGSATEIGAMVPKDQHGQFDYIISSHNFEHLPNPIKFLQGCQSILKVGGRLIMAVPDYRTTFDFFRVNTTIADWMEAFHEDRSKPTPKQLFDSYLAKAETGPEAAPAFTFDLATKASEIRLSNDLMEAMERWRDHLASDQYIDAHCSVFTPACLSLLLFDAHALGYISLQTHLVSKTRGCEFEVVLKKAEHDVRLSKEELREKRQELLRKVWKERSRLETHGLRGIVGRAKNAIHAKLRR